MRESQIPVENHEILFENMHSENSCTRKKQQILQQNTILFLGGETFIKRAE